MFQDSYKHKGMRNKLVKLVRSNGIESQAVLDAVSRVPRHFFFESAFLEFAYQDISFPIGVGQTISQPTTVASQTEMLDVKPGHKVLEIGTGSGYQSSVLLEMGVKLYTIEYQPALYERTSKFLPQIGYNAEVMRQGDGSKGMPEFAPFDRIILTCGAPFVPDALASQLKTGGKMVIPVGDNSNQKMMLITKLENGQLTEEEHYPCAFVPLRGNEGWDSVDGFTPTKTDGQV